MNLCKRLSKFFLLFSVLYSGQLSADSIHTQTQSDKAPPETSQFGQLVGKWAISDSGLNAEGKWQDGNGADWNFYWILGGTAIQDDWISPGMDTPKPEAGRQYGTNIRIYNPKTSQWEMAWAANTSSRVDNFAATWVEDKLVMTGQPGGTETRITFYNITDQQFSWKMERLIEDQWKEIYRIQAQRKTEEETP